MAQQMAGLAGILQNIQMPPGVNPLIVNLPSPPRLEGALAPNTWLSKVNKHALNKVRGPESMVVYNGYVYTGQADGWVVEISPHGAVRRLVRLSPSSCGNPRARERACGRPMGIRLDSMGYLVVADAYLGIFKINPRTGKYRHVVNTRRLRVKDRPLGYINDLAVSRDGTIFFTSSSSRWTVAKENTIVLEADNSGRVLFYNPRERRPDKRVQELVSGLSFPNGLQLSPDESYLLVAEGGLSRILRVWVGPTTPVPGRIQLFAYNLPGVVDNIRQSPRGTFWVGLSRTRHQSKPSLLDRLGREPRARGVLLTLMKMGVMADSSKMGMVLELDDKGEIIRSLQDPQGAVYSSVSEVQEENGILFFASPTKTFIGVLRLPPVEQRPTVPSGGSPGSGTVTGTGTTGGTGSPGTGATGGTGSPGTGATGGTGSAGSGPSGPPTEGPPLSRHPKVVAFLRRIRQKMMKMTTERVKQAVLLLVRELITAKQRTLWLRRHAMEREEELRKLQIALNDLQAQAGRGESGRPTTTTPAPPSTTSATPATATTLASSTSTCCSGGGVITPVVDTKTRVPGGETTAGPTTTVSTSTVLTSTTGTTTAGAAETTSASSTASTTGATSGATTTSSGPGSTSPPTTTPEPATTTTVASGASTTSSAATTAASTTVATTAAE